MAMATSRAVLRGKGADADVADLLRGIQVVIPSVLGGALDTQNGFDIDLGPLDLDLERPFMALAPE